MRIESHLAHKGAKAGYIQVTWGYFTTVICLELEGSNLCLVQAPATVPSLVKMSMQVLQILLGTRTHLFF
jgi:hypothetical protein